jgi:hypothetical protein
VACQILLTPSSFGRNKNSLSQSIEGDNNNLPVPFFSLDLKGLLLFKYERPQILQTAFLAVKEAFGVLFETYPRERLTKEEIQ